MGHMADAPTQAVAPITPETLLDMASGMALVAEAWVDSLERHPDARTGLRILATESYDVWLLRWPAGTAVSPHHHGDSDAAFVVSSGALTETRWLDGRREERPIAPGQGATVERGVVHDVAAPVEALSVHVYAPPLSRMAFFDDQAERVLLEATGGSKRRCGHRRRILHHRAFWWTRNDPRKGPRADLPEDRTERSCSCDRWRSTRGRHASGRSSTAGRRTRRGCGHRAQRVGVATRSVRLPSDPRGFGRGPTGHFGL